MKYYFNFIFFFAQLVFIQSKDPDPDSENFYQKPLTTTIQVGVPYVVHHAPITKNRIASYPDAFFKPRTTAITPRSKLRSFGTNNTKKIDRLVPSSQGTFKRYYYVTKSCSNNTKRGKQCVYGFERWCCTLDQYCGDSHCKCCKSDYETVNEILGGILIWIAYITCVIICYCASESLKFSLARSSTIRVRRADDRRLPSIEPQLVENNNSNGRRETRPSSSPPEYDDVMRQNSVVIAMQQQSLLPPSYDEFMRRNNRKNETSV